MLWTVGVVLVPALLLAGAGLYVVRTHRTELLKIALEPQSLRWIAIGCVAAIVLWVALILTTYQPGPRGRRVVRTCSVPCSR